MKFRPRPCSYPQLLFFLCLLLLLSGGFNLRVGYAGDKAEIKLAAIFSLTGIAASSHYSSILGTQLAVNEINDRGGLLGRPVDLILLDNMSTPIGSSLAAKQAVEAGVVGIIGAQWSSHSLAIAKVAQQNHVPMISNYSTHPELTSMGGSIFRVCFTDEFQGKVMAAFAREELDAETAVIFVDLTSDYSLAISRIFQVHFESLGGDVIGEIEYKARNSNYDVLVEKASRSRADVIFLSGHEESGAIASRLQDAQVPSILLGGDGWTDDAFLKMGGSLLRHGYYITHWSEFSQRKESRKFIEKYGRLENFGTGAALAYDAVMVLAAAIEEAESVDGDKISQALAELPVHEGVTGSIQFNENGDPVKSAVIMEIKNGKPGYLRSYTPR